MGERAVDPGRYAQHPDGSWHLFIDKAELGFVPVACVTVRAKAVEAAPATKHQWDPAWDSAEPPLYDDEKEATKINLRPKVIELPVDTRGRAEVPASHPIAKKLQRDVERRAAARTKPVAPFSPAADMPVGEAHRTASPADVFRAIADQFGILPAVGARSCARFKPLVKRDEDADAAAAYERAIEERQGRH